ncbi:hypothetical protein Gpo141_00007689 [Globisporangium polare]
MIDLIRSYSLPIGSTFEQQDADNEPMVDAYLDRHGVIRRSSSKPQGSLQRGASASKGFLQRGMSDLKLDFLALASPTDVESEAKSEEEDDDEAYTSEPCFEPMSSQELEAVMNAQQDRKRRRSEMIKELRERKRSLLISHGESEQERLQLWYDASELDPAVETSTEHTPLSPSSKAQTFIDPDGNIRRKSIAGSGSPPSQNNSSPIASPRLGSPVASYVPQVRKSLVWEFVQSIIDD